MRTRHRGLWYTPKQFRVGFRVGFGWVGLGLHHANRTTPREDCLNIRVSSSRKCRTSFRNSPCILGWSLQGFLRFGV